MPGGKPETNKKEIEMNTVNSFSFNNALLKSIKDYGNIVKGIVQSRQTEYTPDGQLRSRFIASRQVTFSDPNIMAQVRSLLGDNDEFAVNLSGYLTTTCKETKGVTKWYDNQIVTNLEVIQ